MYLWWEEGAVRRSDCVVHSISWMGRVPDSVQSDGEGWEIDENQYYTQGWLATGNANGMIGVTFTETGNSSNAFDTPNRTNFNLRGHRHEVSKFFSFISRLYHIFYGTPTSIMYIHVNLDQLGIIEYACLLLVFFLPNLVSFRFALLSIIPILGTARKK